MRAVPHKLFIGLILLAMLTAASACQVPVQPLEQPSVGPGGTEYKHGLAVTMGPYYADGPAALRDNYLYYIVEPADPKPVVAPVVLFLHAYMAYDPRAYRSWMEHVARKGYTVVWARYDSGYTNPETYPNKAMATWKHALDRLENNVWEGHIRPQRDEDGEIMTAFIGHSMGGYLSTIMAIRAAYPENRMPLPRVISIFAPGRLGQIPEEHWEDMSPETKVLLVIGDEDTTVCAETAIAVWNAIGHIADDNKDFLHFKSDRRGLPWVIAEHIYPKTERWRGTIDVRDWYISYKLSVAALNCGFWDEDCDIAFGNGHPNQISMGEWSNGTPILPLIWVEDPNTIQTNCADPGTGGG